MSDNKEATVKIFNKGQRIIDDIKPDTVVEVSQSVAKKLNGLFSTEIIIVAEGQDPLVAINNDSAQCASLKKEVLALNEKLKDLQQADNSEVVTGLQTDIKILKESLNAQELDNEKLVKELGRIKKETLKGKK